MTLIPALVAILVVLWRKEVIVALLLFGTIHSLLSDVAIHLWIVIWLQVGLFLFALVRYGMLASILAGFVYFVMQGGVITIDPTRFYFANVMVYIGVLVCLTAFGCVSALGGWQHMLRPQRF